MNIRKIGNSDGSSRRKSGEESPDTPSQSFGVHSTPTSEELYRLTACHRKMRGASRDVPRQKPRESPTPS